MPSKFSLRDLAPLAEAAESLRRNIVWHEGILWARCKARKESICYLTGKHIAKGDEVFRPINNGMKRMRRILASEADRRSSAK